MRSALLVPSPPSWVLRGGSGAIPDFHHDFLNGRYWSAPPVYGRDPSALYTVTRASTAYADDQNGLWRAFPSNTLRVTNKGALIEAAAATNTALWCRDLTNAAWVKTNMTAALDQVGIDGTANSATSLTATAGNATVIQDTGLSGNKRTTAFVKRLTGSGTIQMTQNNGTTWNTITVTSGWTRVLNTGAAGAQKIGFRTVTGGDATAVDFVQQETGTIRTTTPILTTSASATRAADTVILARPPTFNPNAYTIFGRGSVAVTNGVNSFIEVSAGTINDRFRIGPNAGTHLVTLTAGGVQAWNASVGAGSVVAGVSTRTAAAFAPSGHVFSYDGVAPTTDASAETPATPNRVNLGIDAAGGSTLWGYLEEVICWARTREPNAFVQWMTGAYGP